MRIREEVFCSLQIEGIHWWSKCPFPEVEYLREPHRHLFHIKAHAIVIHSDRDVEFIMLKHKIDKYLKTQYFNKTIRCCEFGTMSCEMIAKELINEFNLCQCEVSEDGENGTILRVLQENKQEGILGGTLPWETHQ